MDKNTLHYYVIQEVGTTRFMPQTNRRGKTTDTPNCFDPPRLFTTKKGANCAITWWKKGQSYIDYDGGTISDKIAIRKSIHLQVVDIYLTT